MPLPRPADTSTAVVTGASSGIGMEIARELSRRGQHVTLVARRADRLEELAEGLDGPGADVVATDLGDPQARAALPDRITDRGRHVTILVNNAGFSTLGRISQADPEAELHMIEVDVAAVVDLTVRLLPGMVHRREGAILNVASTAAFQPLPGQAGYGACKAFVLSYTHSLAVELRGSGVSATALCPGPVDTGFGEAAGFAKADADAALPAFMWESVESVARCGVEAMARGRTVAIPGVANRIGAQLGHLAPRRLLLPVLARSHPGLR